MVRPCAPEYDLLSQLDPAVFAQRHLDFKLQPWQQDAVSVLHPRGILNCSRQAGKTTTLAIRLVHHVLFHPAAKVLFVSATEVQAGQAIAQARAFLLALGEDTCRLPGRAYDFALASTGAQIRVLPCREAAMRGYTATLVILDEAALIPDPVFHALTGTLAATWHHASIWIASTPRQRSGFFFEFNIHPRPGWLLLVVPATDCAHISAAYLASQRQLLPPGQYGMDFECRFADSHDAAFRDADTAAALAHPNITIISPNHVPLLGRHPQPTFYLTNDLAQSRDYSSLTVIEHRARFLGQHPASRASVFEGELLVRWIQRLPLGVDYHDLLTYIRRLISYPELAANPLEIVFDRTGGGAIFHDFLKAAQLGRRLTPIVITTGAEAHESNGAWHVPKDDLIKTTQFAFRHRLIKIAPDCPDLPALLEEMKDFRRILNPGGHETFAGRAGRPDDLVMGLSMGVWRAFQNHRTSLLGGQRT